MLQCYLQIINNNVFNYFTQRHVDLKSGEFPNVYTCICCCLVSKLCPTLCNPMDCSLPGSSNHGLSQARIIEWIAISFPRESYQPSFEPKSPACISINCINLIKIWTICIISESSHIILSIIYPQSSTPETIILISIATD